MGGTALVDQSSQRSEFLDLRSLASLAHLRFTTRHRIEGSYAGPHRSRQRGGSAEFLDYREYTPGEDLRRIDWKVLARTGRPYLRQYQDETNLRCTLLIDASASMLFSGRDRKQAGSKLRYVQFLSTAMSHVIASQRDQVGVAVVADGLIECLPPAANPSHVRLVQDSIAGMKPAVATDLARGLRQLFDRLTRRGVLVLMSDFLVDDLEAVFAMVRLFRHARFEVIVLHIVHPEEERLPEGVAFRFEGMENDGQVDCSPADVRVQYERAFEAHAAELRNLALTTGCDYRRISTAIPYFQTLGGFLVERAG